MRVLYVSFGSKVRPRTIVCVCVCGCVAVSSVVQCCLILGPYCSYIL